jgi:phage baseplate assembly protein V
MDNITKNLIRVGRVSAVNPEKATVRVAFEAQGVVSYDLPVLQQQTLNNKEYCLPDVGESVVCIFLPTGNASGFVLGSIYAGDNKPPVSNPDKRLVQFEDGTKIEYDRGSHTLSINAVGSVNIVASSGINVVGDVIADGISLKNHVHLETGGITEKPQ